jgi:hypothetical protein
MLWFSLDDLLLLVLFLVITTIHQGRPFFILPRVFFRTPVRRYHLGRPLSSLLVNWKSDLNGGKVQAKKEFICRIVFRKGCPVGIFFTPRAALKQGVVS